MSFKNQRQIFEKIKSDLFPEVVPSKVIFKILYTHLFSTLLVMSFCPQFGLGLFANGHYGLSSLFMLVSHDFCQLMCGLTLFSFSLFFIQFNLKITEREWVFSQKYFLGSLILLITGSFFWMWAPHINFYYLMLWGAGASLAYGGGGILSYYSVPKPPR